MQPGPYACLAIQLGIKVFLACALWTQFVDAQFPFLAVESEAAGMVS